MSNTKFSSQLNLKLLESLTNNFGKENFDEKRFGPFAKQSVKRKLKDVLRKKIISNKELTEFNEKYSELTSKYADDFDFIYNNLNKASQELFITVIAYRILGYRKVKLPLNNSFYWEALERVKRLRSSDDIIDPHFMHFILERFDLKEIGYDIEIYFSDLGIVIDFIIEQYAYKIGEEYIVQAEQGDVVLDVGGCWADTALYFSHKVGPSGKVYSFEFIPNNIDIFNTNLSLNPKLKERVTLVKHPISETSNQKIYYRDFGPGSSISTTPFEGQTGYTETMNIDDFVERENLAKVDYIKMDIEGAEPAALKGAVRTIKKFRPKLAIATYHSAEDFVNIPKWIIDLALDYEFYLGHYTIHAEETVFFAAPK